MTTFTITQTRRAVCNKARNLFAQGVATTHSEAMRMAWAFVKFAQKVQNGQPVTFTKKDGSLREVAAPAAFVSTGKGTGRKAPAHLFVFMDTAKIGHNVISCDIRNLVA